MMINFLEMTRRILDNPARFAITMVEESLTILLHSTPFSASLTSEARESTRRDTDLQVGTILTRDCFVLCFFRPGLCGTTYQIMSQIRSTKSKVRKQRDVQQKFVVLRAGI